MEDCNQTPSHIIKNDVQDRNSVAWKKLCDYVDWVAETETEEFSPRKFLGKKLFAEIYTLPESISKLKRVKTLVLYRSSLKQIPPEIGQMESLEEFIPYTSHSLYWFPYEITNCKRLKDSTISTSLLYGNCKNRKQFPSLEQNSIRYYGDKVYCSICHREMTYEETNQLWISLWIGTDVVPLLVNSCSKRCEDSLPKSPEGYVQYPHKGGSDLVQPPDEDEILMMELEKENKEREKNSIPFSLMKRLWKL